MGVPRLVLLNSYRVEKSFWQTPFLQPEAIREQLILGLEQARDSVLPEIAHREALQTIRRGPPPRSGRRDAWDWSATRAISPPARARSSSL